MAFPKRTTDQAIKIPCGNYSKKQHLFSVKHSKLLDNKLVAQALGLFFSLLG